MTPTRQELNASFDAIPSTRKNIFAAQDGASAIEFGLALPVLAIILAGGTELTRYAIIQQKLDKIAFTMSDLATQKPTMTAEDASVYAAAASQIMKPFNYSGTIIFTSVASYATEADSPCRPVRTNCITSQFTPTGAAGSQIGSPRAVAQLPGSDRGYQVPTGQQIVVSEVYYQYQPLIPMSASILGLDESRTNYKTALYRPRPLDYTTTSTPVIPMCTYPRRTHLRADDPQCQAACTVGAPADPNTPYALNASDPTCTPCTNTAVANYQNILISDAACVPPPVCPTTVCAQSYNHIRWQQGTFTSSYQSGGETYTVTCIGGHSNANHPISSCIVRNEAGIFISGGASYGGPSYRIPNCACPPQVAP